MQNAIGEISVVRCSPPPPLSPPARLRNCNNKSKNHCLPTQKSEHTEKKNCFFPIEKYTNSVNQENEKEQQKKINRKKVLLYWMHSQVSPVSAPSEKQSSSRSTFCVHSLIPIVLRRESLFLLKLTHTKSEFRKISGSDFGSKKKQAIDCGRGLIKQ
jgi:hypothetical protein